MIDNLENKCFCARCKLEFDAKWEDKYDVGNYDWNDDCPNCKTSIEVYRKSEKESIVKGRTIESLYESYGYVLMRLANGELIEFSPTVHECVSMDLKKVD